jgi:NAD(P)-dependent dehydrogenase (short-subunit alcohol dehydrogenase family)
MLSFSLSYPSTPSLFVICIIVAALVIGVVSVSLLIPQKYIDLKRKYVVITGCDSGFGAISLATIASKTGAFVVALCLTENGCNQALASGAHSAIKCDFLDENAIAKAAEEIKQISGGLIWAIIHNAGCVHAAYIDFQPLANYRRTMEVNFFAIVNLNQRLMPCVKLTGGRVIIVSSVDGMLSLPGNAAYCASKFACEAFAYALRTESYFWGVKVCVINPSTMRTPLAVGYFDSMRASWNAMDKIDPTGLWKREWSKEWLDQHVTAGNRDIAKVMQDPMLVVRDIHDAVANTNPRCRYLSGMASKTIFRFLWNCPESWTFAFSKILTSPAPAILVH